jgi:hypothetical protein
LINKCLVSSFPFKGYFINNCRKLVKTAHKNLVNEDQGRYKSMKILLVPPLIENGVSREIGLSWGIINHQKGLSFLLIG